MLLAQEQERAQAKVQAPREEEEVHHQEGAGGVPASQQAEANLVLVGLPPFSWISFLCADPTDSPRPKGWETTLEPYRMLNHG